MERELGRFLDNDEIIIHKNGNLLDNRIYNLFIGSYNRIKAPMPTEEEIAKFKDTYKIKGRYVRRNPTFYH